MRPAISAERDFGASLFNDKWWAEVIVHVREQYVTQIAFTEYHDKINAFPADRSDQPFSICIFATVSEETSGDFECRWIEHGG